MTAAAGYVTDVTYVPGFYPRMAPAALRQVVALNRVAPPAVADGFRYLELGCGLGRSLTTLATANPRGEFVGIDVNAEHTASIERDVAAGAWATCASSPRHSARCRPTSAASTLSPCTASGAGWHRRCATRCSRSSAGTSPPAASCSSATTRCRAGPTSSRSAASSASTRRCGREIRCSGSGTRWPTSSSSATSTPSTSTTTRGPRRTSTRS